jgi:hypothetical protein
LLDGVLQGFEFQEHGARGASKFSVGVDLSGRHDYRLPGRDRKRSAGAFQVTVAGQRRGKIKLVVPVARIFKCNF